jgi:hypothetical protein
LASFFREKPRRAKKKKKNGPRMRAYARAITRHEAEERRRARGVFDR